MSGFLITFPIVMHLHTKASWRCVTESAAQPELVAERAFLPAINSANDMRDKNKNRRKVLLSNQTVQVKVRESVALPVRNGADIRSAVALGRMMATKIGFEYTDQIRLETLIVEMISHAFREGNEGTVTLRCVERTSLPGGEPQLGLEIMVGDDNSGAVDLAKILAGKESAWNDRGTNVSSVRQLADEFAIDSVTGRGMRMYVRKWARPNAAPSCTETDT